MMLGNKIKDIRIRLCLSQEDLASIMNVSRQAITKWENWKCMPDASLMVELCDILSISVNELLNGEIIDNKKLIFSMRTILISSITF